MQFRIVDLDSGKFRDTENLYDKLQLCWLHGFLDNDRAVLSDEHAIWILDTGGNLRLRELFRLNELPSNEQSKVNAAEEKQDYPCGRHR